MEERQGTQRDATKIKEYLCQCWRVNCQKAQLLVAAGWMCELRCKYCGAPVEVLTIDGVNQ